MFIINFGEALTLEFLRFKNRIFGVNMGELYVMFAGCKFKTRGEGGGGGGHFIRYT